MPFEIFYRAAAYNIYILVEGEGKPEIWKFLAKRPRDNMKLKAILVEVAKNGFPINDQDFGNLDDGVCEFKTPWAVRLFGFIDHERRAIVLTHVTNKPPSNKAYNRHKKKVNDLRRDIWEKGSK